MRTKQNKKTKKQNKKTKQNKNKRTKKQNKKVISDGEPISPDANISCADCNKTAIRTNMLVPLECLQKHGETAHRLCPQCWWSKFAIEGASHECPGCKKGKPLNPPLKKKPIREEDIIVISDSD
jgi:hypothetical protein